MTAKEKLEQQLWNIANTLRGKMGADDFRDYILGFIFYKYLSEKMHTYADKILKPDGLTYKEIDEDSKKGQKYLKAIRAEALDTLGYFLKPSELFSEMARRGNGNGKSKFILDDLTKVLNNIAQSTMGTDSEEDFDHLFEDLDLTSSKLGKTESAKNELIVKVLTHLDDIDFRLEDTESDVLGDAYEYLIGQFASGAGKKAGEFYTPQQVSMILAKIVTTGKKKLKSVYDPTCGSGSLLLRVAKEVKEVSGFYGQESNPTTYNLCRMNMIMHDVHYRKFDIKNEDTLEHPQHIDQRFEAVVANPPFSAKWSASGLFMNDDRFAPYGKLAPGSKADFAFVQHMIHQLDDNGIMACVLPHGALFRSNAEEQIRKYLISDKNYLDAVIGLPNKVFFGTDIATCILVFRKNRGNNKEVLFIDASQQFLKNNGDNIIQNKDINKIVTCYQNWKNEERFSHVTTINKIRKFSYDLNIPRYVEIFEHEKPIDLKNTSNDIAEIEKKLKSINGQLIQGCKELNIPSAFSADKVFKIASGQVRFKDDNNQDYPNWIPIKLNEVLTERKERNADNELQEVFSVAKEKGVVNQIEHLGRSYASDDISNYKIIRPGDLVYTKSPTSGFPFGIIKQNKLDRSGVVSVLYAVFIPSNYYIGRLFDYYFSSWVNTYNYLVPVVHKGAKNTMNINNDSFLNGCKISFPSSEDEQKKVALFLDLVEQRIDLESKRLDMLKEFNIGILQKTFI